MNRFDYFLLIIISYCSSIVHAQTDILSIDVRSEMVTLKKYIIPKTNEKMIIDGMANESIWQRTSFSDSFIDIEGQKIPKYDTRMKMLWDKDYLYIYAQMEEPHIWGNLKQRDTVIFYNNDFEVFIAPNGSTRNYGEIEINSLGTVWDLLLDKPYRDQGTAINHWNLDSLKTAITIYGTLNNPLDIDSMWSVEMSIPMKALIELKTPPRSIPMDGEQWRINFSRVEWDHHVSHGNYQRKRDENGQYLPEYNWVWSNQNVINMHEPEKWGYIQFSDSTSTKNVKFEADNDGLIKQVCYALFRQTKSGSLRYLLDKKVGVTQSLEVKYTDSDKLEATFYKTNFGFEFKIHFPLSNQTFLINESGTIIIQ